MHLIHGVGTLKCKQLITLSDIFVFTQYWLLLLKISKHRLQDISCMECVKYSAMKAEWKSLPEHNSLGKTFTTVQMTCIKTGLQVNMKAQSLSAQAVINSSLTGLTEMLQSNHNFWRFLFLAVTSPSTETSKLRVLVVHFLWGVWDSRPRYRSWAVVIP